MQQLSRDDLRTSLPLNVALTPIRQSHYAASGAKTNFSSLSKSGRHLTAVCKTAKRERHTGRQARSQNETHPSSDFLAVVRA